MTRHKFGLGNKITPYKERKLDIDKPVLIYRCLRGKGVKYSIKQSGKVVAHTDFIMLKYANFIINEKGRQRVIKEKVKNVHAFVEGLIVKRGVKDILEDDSELKSYELEIDSPAIIKYNPYTDDSFMCNNIMETPIKVKGARFIVINTNGVSAYNIF